MKYLDGLVAAKPAIPGLQVRDTRRVRRIVRIQVEDDVDGTVAELDIMPALYPQGIEAGIHNWMLITAVSIQLRNLTFDDL